VSTFAPEYIQVHERIDAFMLRYPEGSLQSELIELTEARVVIKGYAYRTPDDPRPGTGHSSLGIPGTTSFTRGSEVENCETSAWGRAIAALGFEVKRGIATAEEVENKKGEPQNGSRSVQEPRRAPQTESVVLSATPRPTVVPNTPPEPDEDGWQGLIEGTSAASRDDCPAHGQPWRTVPAGMSKSGKPYASFRACPERDCKERPR